MVIPTRWIKYPAIEQLYMSLSQQVTIGKTHREQHQTRETELIEDSLCSICHSPQFPISIEFERFWNFYSKYIAPTAKDYSEITI